MKNLICCCLLILTGLTQAQDQLFKRDNSKLNVKILEINQTEIKYKLFDYQDGPTIILNKNDVALIIYQNGSHEVFNPKPIPGYEEDNNNEFTNSKALKAQKIKEESDLYDSLTVTKNLISFNTLEPSNGCLGISYIREFSEKHIQLFIPVIIGFDTPYMNDAFKNGYLYNRYTYSYINDFRFTRKVFESGAGVHFTTGGKKRVNFFIGPYFGVAQLNGNFKEYVYNNGPYYGQQPQYITHAFVLNRYHFMLNNGLIIRTTKHFNMMVLGGVGYHIDNFIAGNPNNYSNYQNNNYRTPQLSVKLGFSVGYRF